MTQRPSSDPRSAMLRSMLRRSPGGSAIGQRHPGAARWTASAPPSFTPADILWDELELMERDAAVTNASEAEPRTPAAFYRRRSAVAQHRRWIEAGRRLPSHWLGVLRLTAGDAQRLCESLGVRVMAGAAARFEPHAVAPRLAPLGTALASRAVAHMTANNAARIPRELAADWEQACAAASQSLRAGELAAELGRRLLAILHHGFDAQGRAMSARLCRSTLCRVLDGTVPLSPLGPSAASVAARFLADSLAAPRR